MTAASARALDQKHRRRAERFTLLSRRTRFLGPLTIGLYFGAAAVALVIKLSADYGGVRSDIGTIAGISELVVSMGIYMAFVTWVTFSGAAARSNLERTSQHYANRYATEVMDAIQTRKSVPPFTLYLRPFITTGQFVQQSVWKLLRETLLGSSFMSAEYVGEMEKTVATAVVERAPLIGLGKPGEFIGAGRILVADAVWQEAVASLVEHATLIVLAPSQRPGTRWEVEHVVGGNYFDRCILVNLPKKRVAKGKYDQSVEWSGIQEVLSRHGFELPAPTFRGRFLFFGSKPRAVDFVEFALLDKTALTNFFRRVLDVVTARQRRETS